MADVYFNQRDLKLKAVLLFPYQKDTFSPDHIEFFINKEWIHKKGDPHPYLLELSGHNAVGILMSKIKSMEKKAKNQLKNRFQTVVTNLAIKLQQEIQRFYPIECVIAEDYLSIITKVKVGENEIAGRIETKNYFPDTTDDDALVDKWFQGCRPGLIKNIEDYVHKTEKERKPQNVYIAAIPLVNPVADNEYELDHLYVSVHAEGQCQECKETIIDNIDSSIKINLQKLAEHKEDLLIKVVGDTMVCPNCETLIEKEKLVIKDLILKKIYYQEDIKTLHLLGSINKQDEMKTILNASMSHADYFGDHSEKFWAAFSYIAQQDWHVFMSELTKTELKKGLSLYLDELAEDASKEQMIKKLKKLSLTEEQKEVFWRHINEDVVDYYLLITVFGWNIRKEMDVIGPNRAGYIFRYLPFPKKLEQLRQKVLTELFSTTPLEAKRIQNTFNKQQQQLQRLKQENGRLTHKLGESYQRISQLEQATHTVSNEVRNKDDILKIQSLKGLIEELKSEIDQLSIDKVEEEIEEAVLTDEPSDEVTVPSTIELKGKNILFLGGYRMKQTKEEKEYTIYSHDTRTIDPAFYELLKKSDMIVVLTRFISHRAMWEAKEYAILEQKPIYFTSFTNVPTILNQICSEVR